LGAEKSKSHSPMRVEAFSDGVFAVAITLLVLEIKIPHLRDALSRPEAWESLRVLLPKFGSFILSFAYVAVFWVNHHHFMDLLVDMSPGLLWLNNLLLLFLCFIPFPTGFMGEYPANPVALALFAVILMGAGLIFTLMWRYAHRWGLMHPSVSKADVKKVVRSGLFGRRSMRPQLWALFGGPGLLGACSRLFRYSFSCTRCADLGKPDPLLELTHNPEKSCEFFLL